MTTRSDVAVIGAGIVGLAVAEALLARGVDVALLDAGEPGQGQSAGEGRVFRRLHRVRPLIGLVDEARPGWLAWGERAGEPLLEEGGWLRRGGDRDEDIAALAPAATELAPHTALERLPLIAAPPGPLLLDPLGGTLRAAQAVRALARWTAPVLRRTEVRAIAARPDRDEVVLATGEGEHRCRRCLVCAGTGTDGLAAGLGLEVRQARRAHLRLTFALREAGPEPLPAWSDRSGDFGELVYGLPVGPGRYALGIAELDAYPAVEGSAARFPDDARLDGARARIVAYARAAFCGLDPEPVGEVARLTTTLPDGDDDAFALWWRGPVALFAGGNLFKFAPVLGPRLADALLAGEGSPWPTAARPAPAPPLTAPR